MVSDDKENLHNMSSDLDNNRGGDEEGEMSSDHDGGDSDEAAGARDEAITGPVMGAAPTKRLRIPAKFRNRKPQDMPRRPLSAYNLFFRDQRAEIMADRARGEPQPLAGGLFESMAKTIAARWRDISPEELDKYTELAKEDTVRYRAEMERYNKKVAEDKNLEAKRRRAENRKLRQQEKAKLKAMANMQTLVPKEILPPHHGIHSGPLTNENRGGPMPNPFLSLVQIGAATYPTANLQTVQQPDINNMYSADIQMRLLAAHAEGLSRAIPPSPAAGQMSDYIRQMMQGETPGLPRTFQTPSAATLSGRDTFSNYALTGSVPASQSINLDSSDPLTILQMLQQQQHPTVQLPSTTPQRDLESLLSLQQLQINGQVQRQLQSPSLDPALGLWLQLQQQQHQQQPQAQQADLAWINADANFYQQHGQDGSSARETSNNNQGN